MHMNPCIWNCLNASALNGDHFSSDMEEPSDVYKVHHPPAPQHHPPAPQHHPCLQMEVEEEEKLRRKIKYYFMNPCEKYHARGRKPWKLMLQIIKIAIITAQVMMIKKKNR